MPLPSLPFQRHRAAAPHVSMLDRLRTAGLLDDTLGTSDRSSGGPRAAVPALATLSGTQIVGIVYQADYRYEEEAGVGQLRPALAGKDPRNAQMNKAGQRCAARFADVNAFVVATHALPTRTYAWGDDLETGSRTSRWGDARPADWTPAYVEHYDRSLPYTRQDTFARDLANGRITMTQLRDKAKQLGLTGLPRTKAELAHALMTSPEYLAAQDLADVWPAWFHHGKHLVVRADSGPMALVVEALGEAIDAGTLAVGQYSGPFFSGVMLYDGRDETDEIRADRVAACDWYDERMIELEPVSAQLTEWGHRWYFLGKPTQSTAGDGSTFVRYWLNGQTGATSRAGERCSRQPFGWYTLQELLDEKFVRDACEREAEQRAEDVARKERDRATAAARTGARTAKAASTG